MASISFNDEKSLNRIYRYDASAGTFSSNLYASSAFDYFDDNAAVGDCIYFGMYKNAYGMYDDLKFYVGTPLSATSITVVWEYYNGSDGNMMNGTWTALPGLTDNTNAFQNSGENWVTFDVPDDWYNYGYININGSRLYYHHWIRCRITAVDGITEGGAQSTQVVKAKNFAMIVGDYTSETPATLDDIYNASVAGGWGMVDKWDDYFYRVKCHLLFGNSYFETKNEALLMTVNRTFIIFSNSAMRAGEVQYGDVAHSGSYISWIVKGCSMEPRFCSENSRIYATTFRPIILSGGYNYHAIWGGGFDKGETIDVRLERPRSIDMGNASLGFHKRFALVGKDKTGEGVENIGAILQDCQFRGMGRGIYATGSGSGAGTHRYIHSPDLRGNTIPAKTWALKWHCNIIDGNMTLPFTGDIWNSSGNTGTFIIWYSLLLKVIDENENPIEANVLIKDVNGDEKLNRACNQDGYANDESGTATSGADGSITDTSKNWSENEWNMREVYITGGTGAGQRRIISDTTANTLSVKPNWETNPDSTSRYIIIPYMHYATYSTPNDVDTVETKKTPHTMEVKKAGYQTYKEKFTADEKIDWVIRLGKTLNNNFSKRCKVNYY